jgi:hypothetical protein
LCSIKITHFTCWIDVRLNSLYEDYIVYQYKDERREFHMGYFNDDVAGLFANDDKRRRDVAGASTDRRRKRDNGDVAGTTDRRRKRDTGDVAGTSDRRRKRNNGNVAGAQTGRHRKRDTGDVAGTFDRGHNRNDDAVLGTFDNFRIPVEAYVNSEDICRAVRRCLINDLVAGIRDENDDDNRKKKHRRRR